MRFALSFVTVGLLAVGGTTGWAAEANDVGDVYAVPDGGVPELAEFIKRISQFKADTPKEDIQHRLNARRALRQAADKIVELDTDESSDVRKAVKFLLATERVRSIAQERPEGQRKTVDDVTKYVAELVDAGQERAAAGIAALLVRTLRDASQPKLTMDAHTKLLQSLAASEDAHVLSQVLTMKNDAQSVLAAIKQSEATGESKLVQPEGRLVPLDLKAMWNKELVDFSGPGNFEGNGLAELPQGECTLCGVKFLIGDKAVQLDRQTKAKAAGIPVDRRIQRLYVLHATQQGSPDSVKGGTAIGEYTIRYADDSTAVMPIVYGEDVRDWWNFDEGRPVTRGRVVWTGSNYQTERYEVTLRLYLGVWQNPHPDKKVTTVDYASNTQTSCLPFCVAMTVEEPGG